MERGDGASLIILLSEICEAFLDRNCGNILFVGIYIQLETLRVSLVVAVDLSTSGEILTTHTSSIDIYFKNSGLWFNSIVNNWFKKKKKLHENNFQIQILPLFPTQSCFCEKLRNFMLLFQAFLANEGNAKLTRLKINPPNYFNLAFISNPRRSLSHNACTCSF